MTIKKNENFSLEPLLKDLIKIRKKDEDGVYQFDMLWPLEMTNIFATAVNLTERYPFLDSHSYIIEALRVEDLTEKTFIESLNIQVDAYFKRRFSDYTVITSVSLANLTLPSLQEQDVKITYCKRLPKKYHERGKLIKKDYPLFMLLKLKARSFREAQYKAEIQAEQQRALWGIHINPYRVIPIAGRTKGPLNTIYLGDFTVHNSIGQIEHCAFQENSDFAKKPYMLSPLTLSNCRKFTRQLSKCAYKEDLRKALAIYLSAFDEIDSSRSFIVMWAALEALTTPKRANYDNMIARCMFIYKNDMGHKQILEHLRLRRNNLMHQAVQANDDFVLTYQTQDYFRGILGFHLTYAGKFKSITAANDMLDLPQDVALLKKAVAYLS